jgi:class 3 adenylate cyclase
LRVTEIMIAIGIATGDVAGNVGSGKLDYLIIRDAVNGASRLQGMTKVAHTMLANAETAWAPSDAARLAGRARRFESRGRARKEPGFLGAEDRLA